VRLKGVLMLSSFKLIRFTVERGVPIALSGGFVPLLKLVIDKDLLVLIFKMLSPSS
jgi:uncharacterized protein (DUF2344 family)